MVRQPTDRPSKTKYTFSVGPVAGLRTPSPIGTLGGRRGTKAKPLAAYRRRLCCLGRQPALIPVVPAVPIMIVVMIRVIGVVMTVMVGVVPAVPRCGWNRAADYDCANNAQRCSNCR